MVRNYYYSHADLGKFCGLDLKSDNEAKKVRKLTSHQGAFHANSLVQQVASVPDVRRRHSAERLHFDLNLITKKFLLNSQWRPTKNFVGNFVEKLYGALQMFDISQKRSLELFL